MNRPPKRSPRSPSPPELPHELLPWEPGVPDGWDGREVRGELTGHAAANAEVSGSRLVDVRLTAAVFDAARFRDVEVIDGELSGASFHRAALTRVSFVRCRMRGVVFAAATLRDVAFSDCLLDEANFREIDGSSVRMKGCQLVDADLSRVRLQHSAIVDSDLSDATFERAEVRGLRLHGSRVESLRGADGLAGAVIEADQVISLAIPLVAAAGIEIDDEREPGA